jgi:DNA repair protein RecO
MSHTIYTTEAFVISSRNSGESDKLFKIFTRDFGVISAKATGIRKIESRLRFFVQDFKYIEASLVKGKTYWRLTSAQPIHELNSVKSLGTPSRIRSLQLLGKLAPEEESYETLFDDLVRAYEFTSKNQSSGAIVESLEALLALKILYALGYWGDEQSDKMLALEPVSFELIEQVSLAKKSIIQEVNKSLIATSLI